MCHRCPPSSIGRTFGPRPARKVIAPLRGLYTVHHTHGAPVLEEAGARPADVAKLTIYLVEGVEVNEAFSASRSVWGDQSTAVSVAFVRGLAVPAALVEVDAITAIPG